MNALGVTQLVTLLANYIFIKFDENTVDIIAAVLTQLGDTLTTISAVESKKKKQ